MEKISNALKKISKKVNKLINKKTILFMMVLILIFGLIPILWVSFYTHPSSDDYGYGENTINVLESTGIIGILSGVVKTVKSYYMVWQGTYSASVIMALNPSVWGNNMYFLTTFIIIGMLFVGLYYFFRQTINNFLNSDKKTFWLFLLAFFILVIETIPDKGQGLYWWNGASYYMLFFSLELLEWGLLVKRYFLNKKTKLNYMALCLVIAIIGGGNYITALQQIIILCFINIYLIFKKKDKSAILLLLISLLTFGISAVAPGNAIRAARLEGMSSVKAIILSFYYALYNAFMWMTPLNFIILFMLTILLFQTYKNERLKFKYPIIVVFFIFCVFSAEFTPTLYSQSSLGAGRLWNIMYISYLIFFVMSMYYLVGYIREKLIEKNVFKEDSFEKIYELLKEHSLIIFILAFGIIFVHVYINRMDVTTYQTYQIIENGYAKKYDEECKSRIKILEDDSIKQVEFKALTVCPRPIFHCEFSDDPESWLNTPVAKIYNKEYIKVVKE
ncbi:MAG: DUF6056 family protein [Clostridia bacterium]